MDVFSPNQKQNNVIYNAPVMKKPIIIDNTNYYNFYQANANNNINYDNYNYNINEQNLNYDNQHQNIEHLYINNNTYMQNLNDVNQHIYTEDHRNKKYNSKTNEDKNDIYYLDHKTNKNTLINDNNNSIQEKYKNKTYSGDPFVGQNVYKEISLNNKAILKSGKKNDNQFIVPNKEEETLSPIIEQLNLNATIPFADINNITEKNDEEKNLEKMRITASNLSVSILSDIPYEKYPTAKHSNESLGNISGFGVNSYNGKVKNFNEDRIRVVAHHISQSRKIPGKEFNISYFSIFDGHSGKTCSEFLKKKFFEYLTNSSFFPDDPLKAIRESFKKSESTFHKKAYDANKKILLDKSGSCALIMLIIDNILYSINLGDSRALYSYDTGKCLLQITRDHKPNDDFEKKRIENAGGKVYYANTIKRNGKEIELKEEHFGKGFTFPYRISPGKIAVINYNFNII